MQGNGNARTGSSAYLEARVAESVGKTLISGRIRGGLPSSLANLRGCSKQQHRTGLTCRILPFLAVFPQARLTAEPMSRIIEVICAELFPVCWRSCCSSRRCLGGAGRNRATADIVQRKRLRHRRLAAAGRASMTGNKRSLPHLASINGSATASAPIWSRTRPRLIRRIRPLPSTSRTLTRH